MCVAWAIAKPPRERQRDRHTRLYIFIVLCTYVRAKVLRSHMPPISVAPQVLIARTATI